MSDPAPKRRSNPALSTCMSISLVAHGNSSVSQPAVALSTLRLQHPHKNGRCVALHRLTALALRCVLCCDTCVGTSARLVFPLPDRLRTPPCLTGRSSPGRGRRAGCRGRDPAGRVAGETARKGRDLDLVPLVLLSHTAMFTAPAGARHRRRR